MTFIPQSAVDQMIGNMEPVDHLKLLLEKKHAQTVHGRMCDNYELATFQEVGFDGVSLHCENCSVFLHRIPAGGNDGGN